MTIESTFIAGIGLYRSACATLGCEPNLDHLTAIFADLLVAPVKVFDLTGAPVTAQ